MAEQDVANVQTSVRFTPVAPKLVQVTAPHFCAGFETNGYAVSFAAPILRYMVGWSEDRARAYIARKGWKAIVVTPRE